MQDIYVLTFGFYNFYTVQNVLIHKNYEHTEIS